MVPDKRDHSQIQGALRVSRAAARPLSDGTAIMNFLTSYVGKFDMYVEDDYAAFVR